MRERRRRAREEGLLRDLWVRSRTRTKILLTAVAAMAIAAISLYVAAGGHGPDSVGFECLQHADELEADGRIEPEHTSVVSRWDWWPPGWVCTYENGARWRPGPFG